MSDSDLKTDLYLMRADKAQTLMEAEKAMAQIREATAKIVQERDEARAVLACGHHHSLLLKSAETGKPLYCELCDAISRRNDAERMEADARAEVERLKSDREAAIAAAVRECAEIANLAHANKATDPAARIRDAIAQRWPDAFFDDARGAA
jgi:transcriptional antiterminator Rof (Rho-off)